MISLDTETTGKDFYHGSRPYFVTTCWEDGTQRYWEWDVDPITRQPSILPGDWVEVFSCLDNDLVLQNAKFDVTALASTGITPDFQWPWDRTHDTLIAGHLLASNQPHDLTAMALHYLGRDIQPFEDRLKEACEKSRRYCRSHFPDWAIAKAGRSDMPSAKEKTWMADGWLPRTLAQELGESDDHPWYRVLAEYSNEDSAVTLLVWGVMREELHRRSLWETYEERRKLLRIAYLMEKRGVSISRRRLEELRSRFESESLEATELCLGIASDYGHELVLPKNGVNKSLREFCFDHLKLPGVRNPKAKTDAPSLDRAAMDYYESTLPEKSKPALFIRTLKDKRKRDTAIMYMDGYKRFWLPFNFWEGNGRVGPAEDWYILHPNLNITGTDTLRWSSANPNEQNISKQEGFNVRYCFGPAPGREWWSLDYQNLELRIPSYWAGEKDAIHIFEHPEDPPYYGSYHLLVADLLYPDLFRKYGKDFKDVFESTKYKWVKLGNFAIIYGAQEVTADGAYRYPGAFRKVRGRFPKIAQLSDRKVEEANRLGYIETIPDRLVDSKRGYPLMCQRTEWGKVKPTVPLNYFIQGTAMWLTARAMVKCQDYADYPKKDWLWLLMQVHDELDFDLPAGKGLEPWGRNLPHVQELARRMASCGDDIGVPTPVSATYHPVHWGEGKRIPLGVGKENSLGGPGRPLEGSRKGLTGLGKGKG